MTTERRPASGCGTVHLVGAGPGAPDLLTVRAQRLLSQADVLVFDRLVAAEIQGLVPAGIERVFVGKMRDRHVCPQTEINQLLIARARAGQRVVRLKGGDPMIFGRGGEELEALAAAGVPFEVVPGVTAALGCAAAAAIPLTHRDHARSLVFVTAHTKSGEVALDWAMLTRPGQTVVVYMGIKALPSLCTQLIAHGLDPATPAAVIENGTFAHQRIATGTLVDLPAQAPDHRTVGPALIIIGQVVAIRAELAELARQAGQMADTGPIALLDQAP